MLKKHIILLGLLIALILLFIATTQYPGGSQADINSIGFSWKDNYISNLFGEKSFNGAPNGARFWAVAGMMFLSASIALFFIEFSKRIPHHGASKTIKYIGIISMVATFLVATPMHDIMVTIASTLFLVGMFYITVFVLRSKLHLFKFLCVICMLNFYGLMMVYGFIQYREYLPSMQKLAFGSMMILAVLLYYFTKAEDFNRVKTAKTS